MADKVCPPGKIFVFGSNELGIHKRGAAKDALDQYGAIFGRGSGPQGHSWAIPTKSTPYRSLPLHEIETYVKQFLADARNHPEIEFFVTRIGCGLAGYRDYQISPFFKGASANVELPDGW